MCFSISETQIFTMMKNKYILLLLAFNGVLYSQKITRKSQITKDVNTILKKQLEYGKPSFDNPYQYSEKDLEVTVPIVNQLLLDNGYKAIGNEQFNAKIKHLFNRIIDQKSASKFLYVNFIDKCDKVLNYVPNDAENNGLFVVKNQNFIMDLYPLPMIIDYQKMYYEASLEENVIPKNYRDADGNEVKKYLWKDVSNLKEQRKINIQRIVARNMYLFNNNKTYVNWLVTQDPFFIKMLVTKFGYTQESKFNDLAMNDYLNNYQTSSDIGEAIFVKNCKGALEIRTELLKYIKEHTRSDENRLLTALENFGYALKDNNSFTTDEKYKILAYIGNTVDPFYLNFAGINSGNAVWNAESVLYNSIVKDKNIISVFQKNNYYGLSDLKESLTRVQGMIEHSSE